MNNSLEQYVNEYLATQPETTEEMIRRIIREELKKAGLI